MLCFDRQLPLGNDVCGVVSALLDDVNSRYDNKADDIGYGARDYHAHAAADEQQALIPLAVILYKARKAARQCVHANEGSKYVLYDGKHGSIDHQHGRIQHEDVRHYKCAYSYPRGIYARLKRISLSYRRACHCSQRNGRGNISNNTKVEHEQVCAHHYCHGRLGYRDTLHTAYHGNNSGGADGGGYKIVCSGGHAHAEDYGGQHGEEQQQVDIVACYPCKAGGKLKAKTGKGNSTYYHACHCTGYGNGKYAAGAALKGVHYFIRVKAQCALYPLVCRGSILYLKAALMNQYARYPELIEMQPDGTFNFKVRFLRRSKRLQYFLNIGMDGADTMQNIYAYYTGRWNKDRRVPYFNLFAEKCPSLPTYPVILIFDNELDDKNKPIHKFINPLTKDIPDIETQIRTSLTVQLMENSNLHLVTHQLVNGKAVCEIEDLFDEPTRGVVIDGRKLSLKDKWDPKTEYGKDVFSKYVLGNYKSIDFSRFTTILDKINSVVVGKKIAVAP